MPPTFGSPSGRNANGEDATMTSKDEFDDPESPSAHRTPQAKRQKTEKGKGRADVLDDDVSTPSSPIDATINQVQHIAPVTMHQWKELMATVHATAAGVQRMTEQQQAREVQLACHFP